MREDEVVRVIRYDELIILYANKQCQKYGTHQHHYQMIRVRLRLLGRFLNSIKEIDSRIENFADVFQPRYYDATIDTVRIVAGFDQNKRTFEHPAVASNLGTLIKHVGDLLRSEYIKKELEYEQKRVEDFLKLLSEDYGISINRAVAETQTQNNRRKKVILPTTNDIKKLDSFLKSKRSQYYQKLREKFSYEIWKKLAETTLLSLQLFNRRRPGEIERLYLEDFRSYRGIDQMADKETYNALSQEGKALARRYVRFEIRGKLGRGVPVLIHVDFLDCLNLIIQHRSSAGVPSQNEYLFGLPSSDKDKNRYLRACDLMRKYSIQCGAEIPSSLRGTQLRKHIATNCINLNLIDGQVTDLANFMGHHEKIHKDIYRQPVLETDIVKISKILQTAQGLNESEEESDSNEEDFSIQSTSHDRSNASNRLHKESVMTHSTPRRWSNMERTVTLSAFPEFLSNGKIPSGKELQKLIDDHSCLQGRTVPQLRTWLHTQKKNKVINNAA
ncbi:uncharacterized protein LOC114881076 [Osmia bicornis bicornis]|uniref:uncharacterized protein LOC114881076 n=1 Tax=Osmia bicornis bicornis TaxID=1437191 RepID=UPI001EAE91B9|nr:uncharacterized protein LOC114881076 [Osmia bicornis bicornis]